jgi:hypothetical protein
LLAIHRAVALGGGGALRPLFAAFLDEASAILTTPRLSQLSADYLSLGDAWTAFADAALPTTAPLLGQARALLLERQAAFRAHGASAADAIQVIDAHLLDLERQASEAFPLDAEAAHAVLSDLSRRLQHIVDRETECATALSGLVA